MMATERAMFVEQGMLSIAYLTVSNVEGGAHYGIFSRAPRVAAC